MMTIMMVTIALLLATAVPAKENPVGLTPTDEQVKSGVKKPGYSPYAGRNFPTNVYWGDTHLHTNLSIDARAFGNTLGVEDAYRFARGEEVTATHGEAVKLLPFGTEGLNFDQS